MRNAPQVEISLQPWEAFRPDGVILFSDILTPLAGMGIEFDIVKGKGPIIADPIRSMEVQCCIMLAQGQALALLPAYCCLGHCRWFSQERCSKTEHAHRHLCACGAQQVQQVRRLEAEESVPFVGAALRQLRSEVGDQAAVLGFVGAPFTLASYIVEGGSSKNFANLKRMAFSAPETLHALNSKLAESVADYVRYQVRCCSPKS